MPSLRELQLRFAHALTQPCAPADPRISIYRHNVRANLRHALGATYRVTRRVMGEAAFDEAADAFARASPPWTGDLNVYGADFPDWLESHGTASMPRGSGDLARLEWAVDEAARAADVPFEPGRVLQALGHAAGGAHRARLAMHPSCRLLASPHAVMEVWRTEGFAANAGASAEWLLVRREGERACVERVSQAEHAFLHATRCGATLEEAALRASESDASFDLAASLGQRIGDGTIVGVR